MSRERPRLGLIDRAPEVVAGLLVALSILPGWLTVSFAIVFLSPLVLVQSDRAVFARGSFAPVWWLIVGASLVLAWVARGLAGRRRAVSKLSAILFRFAGIALIGGYVGLFTLVFSLR